MNAYNIFDTSLSLFDLILEITVDEEGSIVELASKENGGRTHESLVKLFEDLKGRWRMKSTNDGVEGVLEKELATSQNFLDSPNEGIKKKFLVTPFYILSNV